jgi:NAD(P)-dependent dehydrogenase (short-subunit alcohol dehydrogenase family)
MAKVEKTFEGQVALVTGAGEEIGREIARARAPCLPLGGDVSDLAAVA